jgi:sugar lactone lactonase YvrE
VKRIMLVLAALATVAVVVGTAGAKNRFPETIRLPDGFQPEGIAIRGTTFYVGSIPTGAISRGALRTGRGAVLVQGGAGTAAIGIEQAGGRLYVAGGATGKAFVYDARTGAAIATHQLTTQQTFINDVTVAGNAAWFTDSVNKVVYRVQIAAAGRPGPEVQTIPLTGDIQYITGFNVNGIDHRGNTLVIVQSNTGKLFTVTPGGVTKQIALTGAATTLPNGDGLLLVGRTLYVVQNQLNRIAKVALDRQLTSGRVTRFLTDPDLDVPTTIDDLGKRLYAVNARFGTPPSPTTRYDVVQVRKR